MQLPRSLRLASLIDFILSTGQINGISSRLLTLDNSRSRALQLQMEVGESSTCSPRRKREHPFHGITPQAAAPSWPVMKKGPWDVFINHRGCDTKHKLASTIYHTLDLIGIHAFLDVEELELADSIPEEIKEAMRTAGLHIAIFSKSYAESPWCLAELSCMLETGTPIVPVFYHVEPNDLRWVAQNKGLYAPAFSQYKDKGRYPTSKLEEWIMALERVSNLSGYVLNDNHGDEGMLLKSIVNSVLKVIRKEPLEVAKHPVGMEQIVEDFDKNRQEHIEKEQQVIQSVGIVGLGGSGKTTLATALYNREISSFSSSTFLHDVRASKSALHTKQKKLLEDLHIQANQFDNQKDGKRILAKKLKSIRALIVLDDVDHEDQLDALLPAKESLAAGSLVIVTTREGEVLAKWGITSTYKMQPLHRPLANQLFCWHAFLNPSPLQGFEDLVENFIDVCQGLPLSLKVIGGQLYGRKSKDYWVSQLGKIRRILPKEVQERLKVSYDALDEEEKEAFLDIACFFIDERPSLAIAVWDGSGWSGVCSWETLLNKCLVEVIEVDGGERIRMHDHLRDLGREIAKTHSPSRIWSERQTMHSHIQVVVDEVEEYEEYGRERIRMHDHLRDLGREIAKTHSPSRFWSERQRMHIQPVQGIIATSLDSWGGYIPQPFKQNMELMRYSNVRIGLQVLNIERNDDLTRECGEPRRGLLWLRVSGLNEQHRSIPPWLSLDNIRILEIITSFKLETLWDDGHPPLQLRELLIHEAFKLQSLPRSIGHLKHLRRLCLTGLNHLSDMPPLPSLPEEFCQLQSLEYLDLQRCINLSSLPDHFGDLVKLRHINLKFCRRLKRLPVSFKHLRRLEYLCLSDCAELILDLDNLENIQNLKDFNISDCHKLQVLPRNLTNQASLRELAFIGNNSLEELPASIGQLSKLKELVIRGCPLLTRLPTSLGNLSSLATLRILQCVKLREMPSLEGLVSLKSLRVSGCPEIKKIEGIEHLASLEELLVWTQWRVPGIGMHSLEGKDRLLTVILRAESLAVFNACIQNINIEKWPLKTTVCGRIFPGVQSILDSFTFPGLAVDRSPFRGLRNLARREINLSNAAIACFLVRSQKRPDQFFEPFEVCLRCLEEGEWMVIQVFGEISTRVIDAGPLTVTAFDSFGGWLITGDKGSVVHGFKQLFQTLCATTLS